MVERAEAAEAAMQALERQGGGHDAGPVLLSAPPLLAAELLAPKLKDFLIDYPGIRLTLAAASSRADLGRGEADLALRIGPVEGQTLRLRRIGFVTYRVYGRTPDLGVIRAEPAVTETDRWMREWSGGRPLILNTSDSAVMRAGVASGLGIALLPEFYAQDLPTVGEETLSRPLYLTLHEDKAKSPRVRRVADAVVRIMAQAFERGV